MKSLFVIGTIALMYSSFIPVNATETKDHVIVASELLSLPDLLIYVQDTTDQIINADDETRLEAHCELKKSMMILYALNDIHPSERNVIEQTLDECYAALADAADIATNNNDLLLHTLALFTSPRNYNQNALYNWEDDEAVTSELQSTIRAADAGIIYIQENVSWFEAGKCKTASYTSPRLLYRAHLQESTPKVLMIKMDHNITPSVSRQSTFEILPTKSHRDRDKHESKGSKSCEAGVTAKWGDGKGVQWESYVKGEANDETVA